eukprot:Amastigsp_a322_38.p2 type:complete len:219 gc:universal Amastigsp_a322_38:391-1047(+)
MSRASLTLSIPSRRTGRGSSSATRWADSSHSALWLRTRGSSRAPCSLRLRSQSIRRSPPRLSSRSQASSPSTSRMRPCRRSTSRRTRATQRSSRRRGRIPSTAMGASSLLAPAQRSWRRSQPWTLPSCRLRSSSSTATPTASAASKAHALLSPPQGARTRPSSSTLVCGTRPSTSPRRRPLSLTFSPGSTPACRAPEPQPANESRLRQSPAPPASSWD